MILLWLILIPIIGGLLCWQGERHAGPWLPRWFAAGSMLLVLILSLWLWISGDYSLAVPGGTPQWALEFKRDWIPRFGISFHLALDGLSLMLVVLTALLGLMAVICSWREIDQRVGFFHLNLLWNLGAVIGVFLTLDLFLFFFLWEAMLVPMYFLIALWGHSGSKGSSRIGAATKFFIYTQASGLLMLIAILGLVFAHHAATGNYTFAYADLLDTPLSETTAWWLMLGFFVAFAVKLPVVPLHGWLPDAHAQAPTAGSVDLAGILLKTAAYGMLRFALPLFPEASQAFAPIAMTLGLIGIFYGAILACGQRDLKRLIAYTSISHMGFVLIGIYAGTELALQGVVALMVAHAFSAAGLFILSGQLYERLHTRDMRLMGGLWGRIRGLPGFALVFVAASLGLPGTANFVGEFMVMFGAFGVAPWIVVIASAGLILAAVYSLFIMQRVYYGPPAEETPLADLDLRETILLFGIVALVVFFGIYPQPLLDTSAGAMQIVQQSVQQVGAMTGGTQ